VGFLDIETTGFEANYQFVLSWVIKVNNKIFSACINKKDIDDRIFDKRILKELVEVIEKETDVLVGYYSSRFDIPFIRTRCLMNEIEFPGFGEKKGIDLYYSVKFKMKLNRNSLEAATKALGIKGKNHVDNDLWFLARLGDKKAMQYVLSHNIADVKITEKLFYKLQKYCRFTKKSI
jgi:uncharacterized protein YprB with RNaseH-like and TPR domain